MPRIFILLLAAQAILSAQSLDTLVREALENSPEIRAAQKRVEAARQRPSQASSLPDPMISPGYQSTRYPWPGAGLGSEPMANMGVMMSQEFPFPGKRKLAGDMAEREAEAEWQAYEQARLSVVSRVKQAYYRRSYAISAADVLKRNTELFRKLAKLTEIRYGVGKAMQQDVLKAQTQITILETKLVLLEREASAREAELLSLVNRRPSERLEPPAQLALIKIAAELDELFADARKNSPMLRRDEKMVQRAEIAVNMARKEYYPDFAINGGIYSMGSMGPMYMVRADFKIPLYYFRKQRPAVAEKSHELTGTRRMLESDAQTLVFRIKDDFLMAKASRQLAELYDQGVIPQAALTLESSLAAYETGGVDFLTVMMNLITVVEYEMNYWEELQNLHLALARLEEMTGRGLIP